MSRINKELLEFIASSPSAFHAVETVRSMLDAAGFQALKERDAWEIEPGGTYYTVRNGSSIIAFRIGEEKKDLRFRISAAHSDSPMFKIKAVRVFVRTEHGAEARLFATKEDAVLIPNLAIHFNREVNSGYAFNRQVDLCPMFSAGACETEAFDAFVAEELGVAPEEVIARDLFVVNRQKGAVWGAKEEFLSAPRLDDLQCAFASLKGFLAAQRCHGVSVYCCFDNEEVGSTTRQGAMSTFLKDSVLPMRSAGRGRNIGGQ